MTGQQPADDVTSKKKLCNRVKWRLIPFFLIFFVIVAVLLGVYRFRDSTPANDAASRHSNSRGFKNRGKSARNGWEEGRTNDRWLIVSDGPEIRQHVCSLVDISTDLEWRTLVVGNNVTCCRKSCVLLDDAKVKTLNYEILAATAGNATKESLRNVGYLYAMQHGARHIFDAYPETYLAAQVDLETFKREIHHQLQSLALNVALGLVSERPYVKRVQNPYSHFGRPDLWTEGFRRNNQRYIHNHIYRICEVRPPSIEKFLDTDDGYFDYSAPALTLPGSTVAPFSSKNTLYSIEAFWGLILLPTSNETATQQQIPPHLLRTLWNQAVLGDIAGSMKLSLGNVSTLQRRDKNRKDPSELREPDGLASFLLKWTCSTRSSLSCIRDLFHSMFQFHYISAKSLAFVESWISDLQRSHYLEPPVIPRRRGSLNPCLGADGLYGVAFYPALQPRTLSSTASTKRNAALERYVKEEALLDELNRVKTESLKNAESEGREGASSELVIDYKTKEGQDSELVIHHESVSNRHAKILDGLEEMPLLREFTDNACPGYSQLLPHVSESQMKNVLLIVAMTTLRYDLIPMFEVIYREKFSNILYCGGPHDSIEIFLRKYQLSEDRSFSFLPVHSKYTYECLLGALEMGYNVDGWIMTTDDALINSWNVPSMNVSKVWYGGDANIKVSNNNWKTLDPGSQKLPRSLDGVLKVLEFLKSALIGSTTNVADLPVEHRGISKRKREAEAVHHEEGESELISNPNPIVTDEGSLFVQLHQDPKRKISEPTLDLHNDELLLDLVELKSIAVSSEPTPQHQDELPSLKYDVDSTQNETVQVKVELVSEEHPGEDTKTEAIAEVEPRSNNGTETAVEDSSETESSLEEEEAEDPEAEEEEEDERPVAEVLRKLLVATRNTTNPDGTSAETSTPQTSESTTTAGSSTSSSVDTSDIKSDNPIDHSEAIGNADEIFRLEEDDWSKPNVTTHRENPVIDLFLHSPSSTTSTETPVIESSTKEETHTSEMPVPHQHDTIVFPDSTTEENKTETVTAHPTIPHLEPTVATEVVEPSAPAVEEKATPAIVEEDKADTHVHDTLSALQEIYTLIQENLGVPVEDPLIVSDGNTAYYGGDRTPYRLDPKSIHQFHCERGTNLEFCKVSSEFLYQLTENSGKEFQLTYDKVPMFFIPKKDQLKFYLLSNLMLQNGVTDEIAIPLILSGLSSDQEWVKLEKSYFGDSRATTITSSTGEVSSSNKYPLFNSSAAVLYPADLNTIVSDPKIQKIFCLKYLLRILQS